MAFDINPLGNELYLRQLERDVRALSTRRKVPAGENPQAAKKPESKVIWREKVAALLLRLRHAT